METHKLRKTNVLERFFFLGRYIWTEEKRKYIYIFLQVINEKNKTTILDN